ncbi:Redox-sensing transcriptional repressor Rex [Geodia barretti]|uniref:Redox-sensing transcriptional repressor Rex n=1 Tax=Geodia barretti TaxID=519541 RepID=A0AA35TQL4_GEOBA|nr:Redox-sensing transcriptional repressor Rex [Geodia barretti]
MSTDFSRSEVPEVVVSRLPQYLRILNRLMEDGITVVSSQQLGEKLQVTPAQIRKDLSYFGRFGKQGRGYSVHDLLDRLRQILGVNAFWNVAVVGVGRLGRAIVNYPGFTPDGFHLVAAFDVNKDVIGSDVGGLMVHSLENLRSVVDERKISIAIVAVPVSDTQEVVDQLVACGIRAILNYAPIIPHVREGVRIRNIDPVLSLQSMTYYINTSNDD